MSAACDTAVKHKGRTDRLAGCLTGTRQREHKHLKHCRPQTVSGTTDHTLNMRRASPGPSTLP